MCDSGEGCVETGKWAGFSELSLLADAISNKISCTLVKLLLLDAFYEQIEPVHDALLLIHGLI